MRSDKKNCPFQNKNKSSISYDADVKELTTSSINRQRLLIWDNLL